MKSFSLRQWRGALLVIAAWDLMEGVRTSNFQSCPAMLVAAGSTEPAPPEAHKSLRGREQVSLDESQMLPLLNRFLVGQGDTSCEEADCGKPSLGLCPDGIRAGGQGECVWNANLNSCVWNYECPSCEDDGDCGADQFCSKGECRRNGTCQDMADCLNPRNHYSIRKRCIGYLECTRDGKCDVHCSDGSRCPPGKDEEECFPGACSLVSDCDASSACVDYNCGNCSAIFFDSAGNQVCG